MNATLGLVGHHDNIDYTIINIKITTIMVVSLRVVISIMYAIATTILIHYSLICFGVLHFIKRL